MPMRLRGHALDAVLAIARVEYADGEFEHYLLPLGVATGAQAAKVRTELPAALVAELRIRARGAASEAVLFEATAEPDFATALLALFQTRRSVHSAEGALRARMLAPRQRVALEAASGSLAPRPVKTEQTNSSMVFGEQFILKLLRKLDEGQSPEVELGRFLTLRGFAQVPPLVGWLEYQRGAEPALTLAVLQKYVSNQGDAWSFTRQELARFFERALAARPAEAEPPAGAPLSLLGHTPSPAVEHMIGAYLQTARLLGQRTAELHLGLASEPDEPAFAPEVHTPFHHRSLVQSCKNLTTQAWRALRRTLPRLPDEVRPLAAQVLAAESRVVAHFDALLQASITVPRIRCHGDFHLGQVLYTGQDFTIIDLEGEPSRPLAERQRKRFALTDVAGMLRSFHYAAMSALDELIAQGGVRGATLEAMQHRAALWYAWSSWAFLDTYLGLAGALAPTDPQELRVLLSALLLEKAVYELGYELDHRPSWVHIPLGGILQSLGA